MEDRRKRRRLALLLRAAGLALIGFSLSGAALEGGLQPTLAAPLVTFAHVLVADVTAASTPVPAASTSQAPDAARTPTPTPAPGVAHGGPLTFSISGALSLGQRLQSSVHGDGNGGLASTNTSTATDTAGLLASVQRRTATTTLQLALPLGLALHNANFGDLTIGYYTPKYGLVYGAQPLSFLGGVPMGQTLRGFAAVAPLRSGDLTFFNGPAFGANQKMLDVMGMRARLMESGTLVELGIDRGRSKDGFTVDAAVAGAARTSGPLTQSLEAALERIRPGDGSSQRAFSYQYRADYGSGTLYGSVTSRRIGNGFLAFGSGSLQKDNFSGGSLRYSTGANSVDLDESVETSGVSEESVASRRGSVTFTHLFDRSNVETSLGLTEQRRISASGSDWTGGLAGEVGFNFAQVSTLLGAQFQRATLSYGDEQGLITYSGALQRQFGLFSASASYQNTRQTGDQRGLQSMGTFSLARAFGSTGIALNLSQTHTLNGAYDIVQTAPTITVSRRLSSAASIGLTYGEQRTRDVMNPANSGHNRIFSIQISAPFAIGSGVVQGRSDPRLPATISGSVLNDTSAQSEYNFASAINNGMANIVVVLDDKIVQRTDLTGHYQFNFVSPGVHEVRLESSSLPRGVTVDQPYASVTVSGGQAAQIFFRVGTYGAIAGHVFGRDAGGAPEPLENVDVQLDDSVYSRTDDLGAYSFGRLTAGKHVVSVVETSLPASATFAKSAEKQSVVVRNGEVSTLNFTASPLGSIAGYVTFASALAPDRKGGVFNAYVVAEPGDYAAITDEDGSYMLDNLPAGTYTIDIDPETLPDNTGNANGSLTVTLDGNENKQGVNFTVGRKLKQVVFSLKETETLAASMTLSERVLPPNGATEAVVDADGAVKSVTAHAFGKSVPFAYDAKRKAWIATIVVPPVVPAGKSTIVADIRGARGKSATSVYADLTVDPSLPLVTFKITPARPVIGQYVTVRARFLADVHPGDTIRWPDGQITKLSRPLTGRVYAFSVKISERLMRGLLLTRQGELPITLR
ncbi:MAG TPA: hypothetical protein VJP85_11140 [Candidatus Baltobacteraceae bacterium]|nr:hypothetical protein [Candidatus Baltobacteraceae bacterium]